MLHKRSKSLVSWRGLSVSGSDMTFIRWMIFMFLLIASEIWLEELEELQKELSSLSKLPSAEALALTGTFISLLTSPTAWGNAESRPFLCSLTESIKFCLACKQPDTGGRYLSSCAASRASFRSALNKPSCLQDTDLALCLKIHWLVLQTPRTRTQSATENERDYSANQA